MSTGATVAIVLIPVILIGGGVGLYIALRDDKRPIAPYPPAPPSQQQGGGGGGGGGGGENWTGLVTGLVNAAANIAVAFA